jgi:hypothetical protein
LARGAFVIRRKETFMKRTVMFLTILVLAISIVAARRYAAGDPQAAQQPPTTESAEAPSAELASPLDELAWMVGRWVDAENDSTLSSRCSWTQNHKFLTQSFKIAIDGKLGLEGVQKIGWDPIENHIRSWIFDSEGGFGEGRWIKDGNRWEVKTTFTLASGERASAVNVYTYVDDKTYRWESVDREIAGEMQPNIPEVTVVREKTDASDAKQSQKEASP